MAHRRGTAGGEWRDGQMGYFLCGGQTAIRVFITCAPSGGHQHPPMFRSSPLGLEKGLERLSLATRHTFSPTSTLSAHTEKLLLSALLASQGDGNLQPFIYFDCLQKPMFNAAYAVMES